MCNCKEGCGCSSGMCLVSKIAKILLVIGGLNWGLVGAGMLSGGADWNVVNMILGSMPTLEAVVYLLVGVAAILKMFGCRCKKCMGSCMVDGNMAGKMEGRM